MITLVPTLIIVYHILYGLLEQFLARASHSGQEAVEWDGLGVRELVNIHEVQVDLVIPEVHLLFVLKVLPFFWLPLWSSEWIEHVGEHHNPLLLLVVLLIQKGMIDQHPAVGAATPFGRD